MFIVMGFRELLEPERSVEGATVSMLWPACESDLERAVSAGEFIPSSFVSRMLHDGEVEVVIAGSARMRMIVDIVLIAMV